MEEELTERVLGAFYAVYNELGAGFLEQVYENALALALRQAGLEVIQQAEIAVRFRGEVVGTYRVDLLVCGRVLLEIKAASTIAPVHEAQILNYLKATSIPVGLILNFGPKPEFRRRVYSEASIRSYPRQSVANIDV